ncbi:PREDICTED: MPN domain-containing protein [Gavialis gangeticus]|uniref:MPN domain-containing protein n=1 Tax=Gavialis gangeticus TaxID=94835 RepID=UPI00092FC97A|nr:PREDICTED: MPN domain-containing protein [Gavialis gangeticus]
MALRSSSWHRVSPVPCRDLVCRGCWWVGAPAPPRQRPGIRPVPAPLSFPALQSLVSEGEEEELAEEEEEDTREGKATLAEPALGKRLEEKSKKQPSKGLVEQQSMGSVGLSARSTLLPENGPQGKRLEAKTRTPVRYCTLGTRDLARNPHMLVEVTSFTAINKFQPFNVAISSNVLLLLDFHSHLTRSEVVGYLGGRWDTNTQLLTVLRAFPCRTRLGDADSAAAVEEEICQNLFLRGLSLVGWYHSHPFSHALPSLQDIDAQMDYQLKLQGSNNSFQPCLALICGPYYHSNPGAESKISPFWVMPPPEQRPNDYGIPMEVEVTYVQDGFLTNDVLQEMMLLVEFYKGAPDLVKFQDLWSQDQTYLDKLKPQPMASQPSKQIAPSLPISQEYSLPADTFLVLVSAASITQGCICWKVTPSMLRVLAHLPCPQLQGLPCSPKPAAAE